jgi:hypothetical protein
MSKHLIPTAFAAALTAFALPALAQPAPAGIGRTATLTATVESVDPTTRQAVLRGEDGALTTLTVSPEVRNLRQVKPGDRVVVTYEQALAASVTAPGDTRPPVAGGEAVGRARPGERPGAAAGKLVRVRVKIDAAAPAGDSVTFTGPRGNQLTLPVADPGMQTFVRGLKPGDLVDIVYAEAIGVRVQPAAPGS